ncbi:MAG: ABC transporter permease [Muribaculaceae bacterium]|nr:ABC transporter permease [Muribaculaceae bacterium]
MKAIFRQIRQNRLFSAIYILGSALSIASAMLIVVYLYVKTADIYPEHDRSDIYEVYNFQPMMKRNGGYTIGMAEGGFSASFADEIRKAMASADVVATEFMDYDDGQVMIHPGEGRLPFNVTARYVDVPFFSLFDYEVLHGTLFTQEDFDSKVKVAVITDRLAARLFGSPELAVGKEIRASYVSYTVRGVIREPSFLMQDSYGQVFFPYITNFFSTYSMPEHDADLVALRLYVGQYKLWARVSGDAAADSIYTKIHELMRSAELLHTASGDSLCMNMPPIASIPAKALKVSGGRFSPADMMMKYGVVILILLIVPAVNLGGLIAGHMETRLPEMGVRKSFGARRRRLLLSVLAENMVLTTAGGLVGLAVALTLVWRWRDWMFFLDDNIMADAPSSVSLTVTPEMMFAPAILAIAFVLCLIVNVIAAMVPAWWSLRRPIVESLAENK